MKSILFVFILSFILIVGCGPADPMDALKEVTLERFKSHIAVLAHDSLEGRGPSSRGDLRATNYIASQFKELGLEPAGDNGAYIQPVPMVGIKVDPNVSLDLKKGSKSLKLKFIDDFVAYTGVYQPAIDLKDVEIVFVGYGIDAPEQNWDDYKGADLRGKILLMLNNDPPSNDPKFFGGEARTYYGRWTYKFEIAAKKGAAGAIILHTTESAGYPFQVWQNSWSGEQYDLDVNDDSPRLKLKGATSEEATKKYVAMAGFDLAKLQKDAEQRTFKPVPLGIKLSTSMKVSIKKLQSNNIAGILRGSDPNLNKQYVVFSAHYDHFGIGRVIKGDSIYNGALDNASGVSLMLTMAKAFTTMNPKPKRSLLFVSVTAEEFGLLGSQYFATHPTIPLKDIAANINTDGLNVWGKTNDVTFLGSDRSSLGDDIAAVAQEMKMNITPDQFPEKGYFYRSDHFSFAKVGVPGVSLEAGKDFIGKPANFAEEVIKKYEDQDYHQPSDEIKPDWNFDGAKQEAEFILRLTLRIGNKPDMPAWHKGDEFEAPRLKALAGN